MRVSADEGEPAPLFREDDSERLLGVEILPGEETLLTTTTFEGTFRAATWITSRSSSRRLGRRANPSSLRIVEIEAGLSFSPL